MGSAVDHFGIVSLAGEMALLSDNGVLIDLWLWRCADGEAVVIRVGRCQYCDDPGWQMPVLWPVGLSDANAVADGTE
jgi:hypothetical protein